MLLSRSRLSNEIVGRIIAFAHAKNFPELSKTLCSIKAGAVSESEWQTVSDTITCLIKNSPGESGIASLCPSLLITCASGGFPISRNSREMVSKVVLEYFPSLSVFDKVVFTIGSSQTGLRNESVVHFVNRFLAEERENGFTGVSDALVPSLLLAVATLGISNHNGWNGLVARLNFAKMGSREVSDTALAIVTSRSFPIATVEKVLDRAAEIGAQKFSSEDAVCFLHTICCLEVFRTDLVRGLLLRIGRGGGLDEEGEKLVKQAILSLFLDPKAIEIINSVSPTTLHALDKLVDWTLPEPQRHLSEVAGEVQSFLHEIEDEEEHSIQKPLAVPESLTSWTRETAVSVAMDRFYVGDAIDPSRKILVHIDDETYPDVSEGPLDAFLQLKHAQILLCGWRVLWIREQEWLLSNADEKKRLVVLDHHLFVK